MVTEFERRIVLTLLGRGFYLTNEMRLPWVHAKPGLKWFLRWLKKRQVVDNLKHAPCCPANHYHRQRLVFRLCTCGAVQP